MTEIVNILSDTSFETIPPHRKTGSISDRQFLSALVAMASQKKGKNKNIIVCENIQALPRYIKPYCETSSGCAIVLRMSSSEAHTVCVYFYKDMSDRMSFFVFESAGLSNISTTIGEVLRCAFCKRGELRQAYREGQEDQPGSLGLVLNIIVLWNTIYMDAAIQQLRRAGYPVQDEDVEKLSPLQRGHINMQGRYSFTVPESVSKGELRTLNEY
ncbi:hypothetical protein DK526_24885 [Salmonella enterica]|nr:hypothetical protein [Salmonella enterica]